jgi:pyruvate/2-oxoglutarate/acetoin dehydrogenase E1 component/TPP-dependent pyruvate/acetoin dehydrogenase alpha subunit
MPVFHRDNSLYRSFIAYFYGRLKINYMSIYNPIDQILSHIESDNKDYIEEVIKDYWICAVSRECSLTGRKEVLTGKAKFGILGDGKEVPQVAMARAFQKGDFRSGYYRDQTFMMSLDLCSVQDYFAQLYADTENDKFSKGRQMNAHFATALIDNQGNWLNHKELYNVSSDISSTGGQMARALGLALASKQYRLDPGLQTENLYSNHGNEVSFCTIGDASTSEGIFWETMNAAAVQQVPLAVCVWDDGYGISVPIELQTVKSNISKALAGFEKKDDNNGILIFNAKAWDYPSLVNIFHSGVEQVRNQHIPGLFHIQEVTQPQGHSTSGSHERYKSKSRMQFEQEKDCIKVFGEWMISVGITDEEMLNKIQDLAKEYVKTEKNIAWQNFTKQVTIKKNQFVELIAANNIIDTRIQEITNKKDLSWHEIVAVARKINFSLKNPVLEKWIQEQYLEAKSKYESDLYSDTANSPIKAVEVAPIYEFGNKELTGYQILNLYFDELLSNECKFLAFGEDLGQIGDVNQGFAGLQEKFGTLRVFDTGIREWSIVGQAIGLSMRGLKPIAEIQYLDYLVYALSPLMDDLATVRYRSGGQQMAPTIIRTRGHRLEGIWHSGSPIGMMLNSLRGIHICTPRNMVQAVGMYRTLMSGDDPGIVIECLNGYRLKEKMPSNFENYTVPLGKIEVLRSGTDVTLVSYGSCIRIAEAACEQLQTYDIQVELIDVQTLLPFDIAKSCVTSLQKTNKLLILDEDVPGGASAYIMHQIVEEQNGFQYLDSKPRTITAKANRPPYGSDGDYFTKPNAEDVVEQILEIMREYNPVKY